MTTRKFSEAQDVHSSLSYASMTTPAAARSGHPHLPNFRAALLSVKELISKSLLKDISN
jgi:hypothetical protein